MSLWVFFLPCIVWAAGNEKAWYAPSTEFVAKTDVETLPKTAIDLCTLPPDIGGCTKELIRYYYDEKQDDCRRFIFTGCGGNSNRFMRRAHCRNRCVKDKTKTLPKDDVITRVPAILHNHVHHEKESKPHRRTLTTPPPATDPSTTATTTTRSTIAPPVTKATVRFHATETPISIRQCPHCDPLFGVCIDGECGCIKGFKKLGRICIDIDECQAGKSPCPANTYCENTVGSFKCDCASGLQKEGSCEVTKEACDDEFDMNLAEEDCNHGQQIVRYYLDKETNTCKEFVYGGCRSRSRNIFENLETCQQLCADKITAGTSTTHQQVDTITKDKYDKTVQPAGTSSTATPFEPSSTVPVEEQKSKFMTDNNENHGIPERFRIDLTEPSPTPALSSAEKQAEVQKVEEIISEITPELDPCQVDFDEVLRLECMTANWEERFFWNRDLDECEPFWYDSSCDVKETVGKNFHQSYESCQQRCNTGRDEPTVTDEVQEFTSGLIKPATSEAEDYATKHPLHYLKDIEEPIVKTTVTPILNVQEETTTNEATKNENPSQTQIDLEDPMGLLKRVPTTSSTAKPSTTTEFSLPPPHSSNFVTKSSPLVLFDRAKYMAEFKKKLLELPAGKTTPATAKTLDGLYFAGLGKSGLTKRPLFTLPPSVLGGEEETESPKLAMVQEKLVEVPGELSLEIKSTEAHVTTEQPKIVEGNNILLNLEKVTKRPPFTLPPFEEKLQTTPTISILENLEKTKYETQEKQKSETRVDDILQIEQINEPPMLRTVQYPPETTPAPLDFVTQEKNKIEFAINEMNRLPDLCDEPLHPTLEEDCMNEQWVIRWFFNPDRGACKTFWYGGCPTDARNFFKDSANCNAACAHKMPVPESALRPKYITNPLPTQSAQTTIPRKNIPVVAVLPPYRNQKAYAEETETTTEQAPTTTSEALLKMTTTTTDIPYIAYETSEAVNVSPMDIEAPAPKQEPITVQRDTIRTTSDICALGYEEKWDEDCSGDNWEVKSYYDPKAKKCKKFWWGGCMTDNQNVWKDQQTCIEMCMPPEPTPPAHVIPSSHFGTPRLIRDNAADGDTQSIREHTDTQPHPEQASTMIISESLLSDDSQYSSISESNRIELDVPSKAQKKEKPLSDEASHEWHASPHRPRRKFSLKVRAALVENRYNKRRSDRHFNPDRDALEQRAAAGEGDWRLMNDAPAADEKPEAKTSEVPEATGPAFEANLQRELASVKRIQEDRQEFMYSNQHQYPVTVACTFIAIVLYML